MWRKLVLISVLALSIGTWPAEGAPKLPAGVPPSWASWSVDLATDTGRFNSLQLEQDQPRIAYYEETPSSSLRFAYAVPRNTGNCGAALTFYCETIDTVLGNSAFVQLSIGAVFSYTIAYRSNGDLKFARRVGATLGNCGVNNTWNCDVVDTAGVIGRYNSLAFDPVTNNPRISYYDETNGDLKLAQFGAPGGNCGPGGNSWRCDTVDSTGDTGWFTSLAYTSDGHAVISYYLCANAINAFCSNEIGDLRIAREVNPGPGANCTNGGWQCITLDSTGDVGWNTSLVLDSEGLIHVSYFDCGTSFCNNGDLKYSRELTTTNGNCGPANGWQCDTIDALGGAWVGEHSALRLATGDVPHIMYYDRTNTRAKLAYPVTSGGNCGPTNTWLCTPVLQMEEGDIGFAFDSAGLPRVSVYDRNADLRYGLLQWVNFMPITARLGATLKP